MAIEDILPMGNPMGDTQNVNQMEFLRFQEQMGLGQGEVVGKLIQMFMNAPSEFTAKFGVESADAIRELMEMTTQKKLEEQGQVFAPNSAEIIGQNISFRAPENSAIGTLQTDQADKSEEMMKFLQNQLLSKAEQLSRNVDQFRVLGHDQAQEMGLPVDEGQIWQMNETTGKVEALQGTTTSGRHRILDVDEAMEKGLPVDQGQIWELNQMTGQVNLLDTGDAEKPEWITKKGDETQYDVDKLNKYVEKQLNAESGTYRVLTDEEVEVLGFPTADGQIYEIDEVTNDVRLKEPGLIEGGILKLMDWFKYGKTDRESR